MLTFSFNTSGGPGPQQDTGRGFGSTLAQQASPGPLAAVGTPSSQAPAPRPTMTVSSPLIAEPAPSATIPVPAAPAPAPAPAPTASPAPAAPAATPLTQTGTDGDDVLIGSDGPDTIDTGTGFDIVRSGEGRDRITVQGSGFIDAGGANNDVVTIIGSPNDFQRTEFDSGIVVFSGNDGRVIVLKDAEAVLFAPDVNSSFAVPFEPMLFT